MNSFRFKFGKFLLILGGLSLLLFIFSTIADSVNFKLLLAAFLLIVLGVAFRLKRKEAHSDMQTKHSSKPGRKHEREHERLTTVEEDHEDEQSYRHRRR